MVAGSRSRSSVALAVDQRGNLVSVSLVDAGKVGSSWEPPPPLAVQVLDLAPLAGCVRIAEPRLQVVGGIERWPLGPLCSSVKGDRPAQMGRDSLESVDETGQGDRTDRFSASAARPPQGM